MDRTAGQRYGSDLIVDLMREYEIPYAALMPGSTFRGLHDSIVNYGGNQPEIIECPHEKIAVGIAHGYAKTTGRPMAAIVHDVVGLLQGSMGVYTAYLDRVPVIVMGGAGPIDPARRRPHIDWIHTAIAQGGAVRDYVKWDYQPLGAADVVESFARAYRVAMTDPQGPVYLCYDAGYQEDPLDDAPPIPPPAAPGRLAPEREPIERLGGWLVRAENPVILADYLGRRPEAVQALVELATFLGAAVVDRGKRLCFPSTHPLNLTESPDLLGRADLILALDVRDLFGAVSSVDRSRRLTRPALREDCRLAEIGLGDLGLRSWPQDQERFQRVDLSILGDTSLAVPQLLDACRRLAGEDDRRRFRCRGDEHAATHAALRSRWAEEARAAADQVPASTAHLAATVWEVIREDDWVLAGNTLRDWALRLWDFDRPDRHPGKGLGTATEIGISLGVALAHRGEDRLVVSIQPDGDLMFDVGALWVAAHHRIPMLTVMYDNRAYYNDWEHQILVARARGRDPERAYLGMEINQPAPDYAMIARAFGWHAEGPIERPQEIRAAVARAREVVLRERRPALVDVVCQPR